MSQASGNFHAHPSQRYRQVQVNTASKDELLLLLLDGGVRFSERALLEMEKGREQDVALRSDQLVRAQKILLELMGALSPAIGIELFQKLQGLYRFTFNRLFEGNIRADLQLIGEGVKIFKDVRDLWREAVEKARAEKLLQPEKALSASTLSVQG